MSIHEDGKYGEVPYELYNEDGVMVEHKGLWLISDGGYHRWKCMAAPMKLAHDLPSTRWSCSLESVRKDVECVNGQLKSRFRELKNPMELHNKDDIDNVFFTCCVLHNMLLEYDGFDRQWEENVEWEGDPALHPDAQYDEEYDMIELQGHRAEDRLHAQAQPVHPDEDDNLEAEVEPDHYLLRNNLITHYSQAYSKREIVWLKPE